MLDDLRKARLEKLKLLKDAGVSPYPSKSSFKISPILLIKKSFKKLSKTNNAVSVAGRITAKREHGGSVFIDISDGETLLQVFLGKNKLPKGSFELFSKAVDIGDFVAVSGKPFYTKRKEPTIEAKKWEMLAKSLLPLPEKWHGLQDPEEKLRKRYLEILFNPEIREMIEKKALFWNSVREFHLKNDFLEVETPALEVTAGGADANPFITRHQALDMNVYLRLSAGELWQKRLMVAGFKKTFEIGRIFRNEGMSAEHLQDYTQCEAYWAYADYKDMYEFLKECYIFVAKKTFKTLKFRIREFNVNLGGKWPLIDYAEEIKKQTKIDIWKASEVEIINKVKSLNTKSESGSRIKLIDALWKYCRKNIGGPAILINEPKFMSPLAKSSKANPNVTERFHFLIGGSEMGQGYSELNDPIDQRERFIVQEQMRKEGDESAQMKDEDFIEALEHGMPPTAGHGFSERLFSFLIDKPVRENQIFPLVKPKK